ncbi:hypothetical protein DEU56DRAFT_585292 [Suillus clintonianus]|uniref:uncharacterized protein n=1 Tax=Suillus clintonianus TaxID=1904413 RepID=UPI001B8681D3|nr:uncharacterized protein DEU56DRAFT_585292 [Suillus clintonianus]KAG2125120.1 hypothetical protein DEU56DRAFT_585292 [Suillus clintonianus]
MKTRPLCSFNYICNKVFNKYVIADMQQAPVSAGLSPSLCRTITPFAPRHLLTCIPSHPSRFKLLDVTENSPPRKKHWERLKPSRSEPHSVEERGGRATSRDPSFLSPSRNEEYRARPLGPVRKLFGTVTKRFAQSARQSPNPGPTAAVPAHRASNPFI